MLTPIQRIIKHPNLKLEMPCNTVPFAHQLTAYQIGITLPHVGLLMEQGTGKTLPAIGILGRRSLGGEVGFALIVSPLSVIPEWERQLEEHANFPYTAYILPRGRKRKEFIKGLRILKKQPGLKVLIMTYESLRLVKKPLMRYFPDMIIADESHKVKHRTSAQSRSLRSIGCRAKFRLILTGTPVSQSPLDFFSQYLFLDPSIFGTRWQSFEARYARKGGYMGKKIISYRRLDELSKKAYQIAYRVTKAEALDLPPTVDEFVYAELEPVARKHYKQLEKEMFLDLGSKVCSPKIALTKILRLHQLSGGFLTVTDLDEQNREVRAISKAKLSALNESVIGLAGKQVVIFCLFRPELEAISLAMKKLKVTCQTLSGGTTLDHRRRMIRGFQAGTTQVLICQIAAGGVGITLTAADTAIFYSFGHSLMEYEQAKARLDRVGQTKNVTFIHILGKDTVDETILKSLREKRDIAMMVVDDIRSTFLQINKGESQVAKKTRKTQPTTPKIEDPSAELKEMLDKLESELGKNPATAPMPQAAEEAPKSPRKPRPGKTTPPPIILPDRPKRDKADKPNLDPNNAITVKELASELKVEGKKIRKWLRTNHGSSDGRWEWSSTDPLVDKIRAQFGK